MRKNQNISSPPLLPWSQTSFPNEISLFWDRPQQCQDDKILQICKKCALTQEGPCQETAHKCVNCSGEHATDDKKCQHYAREIRLQKFKSSLHLSISEAWRLRENCTRDVQHSRVQFQLPPPNEANKKSKTDITTLNSFIETLTGLFHSALDTQMKARKHIFEKAAETISVKKKH